MRGSVDVAGKKSGKMKCLTCRYREYGREVQSLVNSTTYTSWPIYCRIVIIAIRLSAADDKYPPGRTSVVALS